MPARRLLHFIVGSRRFALPLSAIMEIREISGTTAVPGAPAALAGLVDIRGRIVTLIDLAEVYGIARGSRDGFLAVQFAEPFAHLGILIRGRVEGLETDPGTEELAQVLQDPEGGDTPNVERGRPARSDGSAAGEGSDLGSARADETAEGGGATPIDLSTDAGGTSRREGSAEERARVGREILLSGGRPALRLDVEVLVDYCTDRLRERFRIAT